MTLRQRYNQALAENQQLTTDLEQAKLDLASCETTSTAKDATIAEQEQTIDGLKAELAASNARVAELESQLNPAVTVPRAGLWPDGPDLATFKTQCTDLGLTDVQVGFRERGGRGGLDDPLIKADTLPGYARIAVEVDPRWSGSQQSQYPGAAKMALETAKIAALAQQAAARQGEIAYVEVDSEADLDKHAPSFETLAQRQVGFQKFFMAVADQFDKYAPDLPLVPSFMRGLWTGTSSGKPEDWLTPEVLARVDGIGVDGYSSPYSATEHTPDALFTKAIAWHTSKGKPTYITEWGSEEYKGDDGSKKGAMYDTMLAFLKAHPFDGKTGVAHIMLNTDTDGPAPSNMNWRYTTTPKARDGFIRLTQGLLA